MTHFTNRLHIEETPEFLYRSEIDELLDDCDDLDIDMDDKSVTFESLLDSGYDF
jgi:hypothetical protein